MTCIIGAPLSPAAGVTITGVDLSAELSPHQLDQIREAFRRYHVVVFPDQALSREEQYAFIAKLGVVERHGGRKGQSKRHKTAHVISNLGKDGNPVDRSSSPVSNYRWH